MCLYNKLIKYMYMYHVHVYFTCKCLQVHVHVHVYIFIVYTCTYMYIHEENIDLRWLGILDVCGNNVCFHSFTDIVRNESLPQSCIHHIHHVLWQSVHHDL